MACQIICFIRPADTHDAILILDCGTWFKNGYNVLNKNKGGGIYMVGKYPTRITTIYTVDTVFTRKSQVKMDVYCMILHMGVQVLLLIGK